MARTAPGLSIGQLVSLTFGFLVASVLIFAFGWWVGYDVAEQRLAKEQQVIRLPAKPPPPTATATRAPSFTASPGLPTATPPPPTATRTAVAPTRPPTRTAAPPLAPTSAPSVVTGWTVQANATTDPVQAVVLARRLRSSGYDAYTVTGPIGGVMWYRVRVGRFRDRAEAQVVADRLQREEGLEAAFVAPQ
jgi:cell division septation protein DedD